MLAAPSEMSLCETSKLDQTTPGAVARSQLRDPLPAKGQTVRIIDVLVENSSELNSTIGSTKITRCRAETDRAGLLHQWPVAMQLPCRSEPILATVVRSRSY